MELRAPLTPAHIKKLVEESDLKFIVQHSDKRVFKDEEYVKAGAVISESLEQCPVIFGVKEMPISFFEKDKTYIFFSHVVKGQSYNMPMLKKMMELKCNLIDYERIADDLGRRLIFFGRYAGLAGMINTLWSLGLRLKEQGYDTPFIKLKQSHQYSSLQEAKEVISQIGFDIAREGLPKELGPFVIGFTGYGNVSNGAQEITSLLPVKEISPEELFVLRERGKAPSNVIYKTVFREEHLSRPINSMDNFDLQDYYDNPEKYESKFEQYIPKLTVLVNGMYWDERYPKIVTKDYLEKVYKEGDPTLKVIGDITCDIDGSIECTTKAAPVEDPIFVYNPFTREIKSGYEGEGLQMMTVDILPAELPREASTEFGDALISFTEAIAKADYKKPFMDLELPNPIKKAMILYKGELTPDYKYIEEYL